MRIIAGEKRGTKLYTLEGLNTRPTLDRVKESLFNIIQSEIRESVFLDIFAGSGAIGLEAVSRGAKKAILCDNNKQAIQIIKKNIEKLGYKDKIELYQMQFNELINKLNEKIDIIYLDPPYKTNYAIKTVELLLKKEILKTDSLIIIETDQVEELKEKLENLNIEIIDKRKYGRANLIFIQQKTKK